MLFSNLRPRLWLLMMALIAAAACTLPGSNTEPTSSVPVISGAPVIQISSPLPNATYLEGTDVNVVLRVENAGPDIARVEITLDGAIIGTALSPNPDGAAAFVVEQSWKANVGQHTIAVTAFRADNSQSDPKSVTINVVPQTRPADSSGTNNQTGSSGNNNPSPQPSNTPEPPTPAQQTTGNDNQFGNPPASQNTNPPAQAPTSTPEPPTPIPPSPTPNKPQGTITTGANVRSGPSTAFNPPIGSLAANTVVDLLGINPDGTWYKIRYYNADGWISSTLMTVTGSTSSLPVDVGPPTPIPATATPIPPTATPAPQINLTVVNIQTSPHPLVCQKASEIQVTVRNEGAQATASGGTIRIWAILVSSGQEIGSTETVFPALQPGQQFTAGAFLTVSVNHSELQRILVEVDSKKVIGESNENDNTRQDVDYTLAKGSCP